MGVRFFGQYLLANGYITAPQLLAALEYQEAKNGRIGDIAVEHGMLTREQAEQVHARQLGVDMRFGELAVQMGLLRAEQVEQLLSVQRDNHVRLGEALIALGYLDWQHSERALTAFFQEQEHYATGAIQVPHQVPMRTLLLRALELTERMLLRAWNMRTKRGTFVLQDDMVLLSDRNARIRLNVEAPVDYVFAVPDGVAKEAARHVLQADHVSPEEQEDVVRELANVVCGHLMASLASEGKQADISPPEPLPFRWDLAPASSAVQVPLLTRAGQVFLVMSFPVQ
jgi:hypothetical protein